MIRNVELNDASEIVDIYNYYIENTMITFEEEKVTVVNMENRITDIVKTHPWIVYTENNKVLGYAYASKWRPRSAYRYSVETSVYIQKDNRVKGLGSKLYEELLQQVKQIGIKNVIGGMSLPNVPSQMLHEKFGFKKVAHFEKVGFKMNTWIDVGYWELRFV